MKPNIFSLSSKELSQDAFLCWLARWANPKLKEDDPGVHQCARSFLQRLLEFEGYKDVEITQIETSRQWRGIDVWITINGHYSIIIEDKLYSGRRNDQLVRYREIAEKWCQENGHVLIPVYYKTGNESQFDQKKVKKDGYHLFKREDMLAILNQFAQIDNDILSDYKIWLQRISDKYKSWQTTVVKDWSTHAWAGFFTHLEREGVIQAYHWVDNANGGFLNGRLKWFNYDEFPLYLQIEQGDLCFKISTHPFDTKLEITDAERRVKRNEISQYVRSKAKEQGLQEVTKPKRFGSGIWMTVAKIERDEWMGSSDEFINLTYASKKLKGYEFFLESL